MPSPSSPDATKGLFRSVKGSIEGLLWMSKRSQRGQLRPLEVNFFHSEVF